VKSFIQVIFSDGIEEIGKALYDYTHTDPTAPEFLTVHEGEMWYLKANDPALQGWRVGKARGGTFGFVPGNYLQIMPPDHLQRLKDEQFECARLKQLFDIQTCDPVFLKEFCDSKNLRHIETSARDKTNVKALFDLLAELCIENHIARVFSR